MREIKFRAWDGEQMIKLDKYFHLNFSDNLIWECFDDDSVKEIFKVISFMQFTGLNDKNGKEIYEGDVLLRRFKDSSRNKEDKEYYIVEIKDQRFAHSLDGAWSDIFDSDEVIGNIYENPELIGAVKNEQC